MNNVIRIVEDSKGPFLPRAVTGERCDQVKQIGNSVPVMTAAAMCEADFAA